MDPSTLEIFLLLKRATTIFDLHDPPNYRWYHQQEGLEIGRIDVGSAVWFVLGYQSDGASKDAGWVLSSSILERFYIHTSYLPQLQSVTEVTTLIWCYDYCSSGISEFRQKVAILTKPQLSGSKRQRPHEDEDNNENEEDEEENQEGDEN